MSERILAGRLVYRPLPHPGESLNGYMLRLSEGNQFFGIRAIVKRGRTEITELSMRLGLSPQHRVLRRLATQSANQGRAAFRVWNNQTARYCPDCLNDEDLWRQEWDLGLLTCCPTHGVRLVCACYECGRLLDWKRRRLLYCDCGASLKSARAEAADIAATALAGWLVAKYSNHGHVPEFLELMSLPQLHHLIVFIGAYAQVGSGARSLKISRFNAFETGWSLTQGAAQVLPNWPSGLYALLDNVLATNSEKKSSLKLGAQFGAFYKYLFKTFREKEYGAVIHAFESYVEKNWKGSLANRNRCLSPSLRKSHTWVPANLVAKELRTSRTKLLRLCQEERISGHLTQTRSGRTVFCVDRREVPLIKGLLHDLIDKKTACRILGISKDRVTQLAEHVLLGRAISPNKPEFGPAGLSRQHVEAMPHFGGEWSPVKEADHPDKMSLGFALKHMLRQTHLFPRLVIAVLEEKLRPVGLALERDGIAAWMFDREDLAQWIACQNRGTRDGAMTVVEAAKELRLKQEVAYYFTRQGILGSYMENDTGQTFVTPTDLEEFRRAYVLTDEISIRLRHAQRSTIPSYLKSVGIEPFLDPALNLCRQYLYERTAELEQLMTVKS